MTVSEAIAKVNFVMKTRDTLLKYITTDEINELNDALDTASDLLDELVEIYKSMTVKIDS